MPDAILITCNRPQSFDDYLSGRPGEHAVVNAMYVRVASGVANDSRG